MSDAAKPQLRFGFVFDFRNPPDWQRPWSGFYAERLEFISWLETIGFNGVWLAEHHGVEDGYMPSPLMIGAAIAARTKRMRISPGIAIAPFYHPVRLAEDIAVLDNISDGRAELALGTGYRRQEAEYYGADFQARGRYTNEMLPILKRLLEGETVTSEGEFFNIKSSRIFPLPMQKPRMPIMVGGVARPGLRRAACYGDGLCGGVDDYSAYIEEVRALGRTETPRLDHMGDMWLMVSEDPERTLAEITPHYCYQLTSYSRWQGDVGRTYLPSNIDEIRNSGIFRVLTSDEAIALIRNRMEQVPAMESFCMMVPAGLPLPKLAAHAKLFAEKVIPAFR